MKNKALTLLELILAMTMLSIILAASGSLNLFVFRAANLTAEEIKLQNQLEYVLKDMEEHLLETRSQDDPPIWQTFEGGGEVLTVTDENDPSGTDDDVLVKYQYTPGTSEVRPAIVRCMTTIVTEATTCTTVSQDFVIKKPDASHVFKVSDSKLIKVNLAAQAEKHGKIITIEGTRSYLLRGSET
jgi:type II secretory pathway pseudopilin PulG